MTLLNLNPFWITKAEFMSKRNICKSKFHVRYHFLYIYGNPGRKNFVKPSCPKQPKITNGIDFCFLTSLWCARKASSFWGTKKKCEKKNYVDYNPPSPIIPSGQQGLRLCIFKLLTTIFISLTIEIHKNNSETFRVTNKHYYKLTFSESYCQILHTSKKIVSAALKFQHFLLWQIKCWSNCMKIHFALALPWPYFFWG